MSKYVGYCRVSGESQRDNASLPVQEESIRKWCTDNKHDLGPIFTDVQSGETAETREALNDALALIYADRAHGLVVHKLDRFSRSVLDSEQIRVEFDKRNKRLVSICDPIDFGSDDSILLYQMKQALAERERKEIVKRCKMGR